LLAFHGRLICWKTLHVTIGSLDVSRDATYIPVTLQANPMEQDAMSLLFNALLFSTIAVLAMGVMAWLAYGRSERK